MTFTKIEGPLWYTGRCGQCNTRTNSKRGYKSPRHSLVCAECVNKPYLNIKALQPVSNEIVFTDTFDVKVDLQLNIPPGEHIGKDSYVIISFSEAQLRRLVREYIEKVSVPKHPIESEWLRLAAKTL